MVSSAQFAVSDDNDDNDDDGYVLIKKKFLHFLNLELECQKIFFFFFLLFIGIYRLGTTHTHHANKIESYFSHRLY